MADWNQTRYMGGFGGRSYSPDRHVSGHLPHTMGGQQGMPPQRWSSNEYSDRDMSRTWQGGMPPGAGGGGGGGGFQGRGIDDLKDERIRRLEQDKEELRSENSAVRAAIASLQLESSRLESEYQRVCNQCGLAEQQATMDRRDKDELQSKLTTLHRDLDELRGRNDAEKSKMEMEIRTLETRVQRKETEFDQLKMERDTIVSALRNDLDHEKSRREKELSSQAKDFEMARETDRKRYAELEERYSREQSETEKLRESLKALDEDRRTLGSDKDTLKQAITNKANLLESVRADAKAKKERIEELVKVVSTMESDRKDMEATVSELKADAARAKKKTESLEEELKAALADRDYTEGQQDRYKKAYEELARILSATDVQLRGMLVNAAAAELVGKAGKLEVTISDLKADVEKEKNKVVDAEMKTVQAERARDMHRDALLAHKDELAAEKRKRLELTRAHRALIAEEEERNRTIAANEAKIKDLEKRYANEQSAVKKLQEEREEVQKTLQTSSTEWYDERAKLQEQAQKELAEIEADHAKKVAQLQAAIDEMDSEAADQIEYTDMCKSLARLLHVEVGTSAATTARELYHRVDTLMSEVTAMRNSRKEYDESRTGTGGLQATMGWNDIPSAGTTNHSLHLSTYNGGAAIGAGPTHSASDVDRIRKSLVKQKLEFDSFVQEVSTALGVPKVSGERPNTAVLVQRIVELMSEAPTSAPTATSSGKYGAYGSRSRPTTSQSTTGGRHTREHRKQHEDLQRRYRLALRTIQTLDKLYSDVAAKQPALDSMHTEHHQLLEEVTRLKQQLRSGGVVGAMDLGGRGGEPDEVQQLRTDLKKYIGFYDKVLAALGHRSPNIPMAKIVDEIKTLKQKSRLR